jgi:hypothetical protein
MPELDEEMINVSALRDDQPDVKRSSGPSVKFCGEDMAAQSLQAAATVQPALDFAMVPADSIRQTRPRLASSFGEMRD